MYEEMMMTETLPFLKSSEAKNVECTTTLVLNDFSDS